MMREIQVGDVKLNVLVEGGGRPLLLVHGFPLDHSMWRCQIDEFASEFQVIALDLRGFGGSELGDLEIVSMERFAHDLAGLLVALDVTDPVAFCGLSMGGYVGWQFALRHGNRLDKLILCDTKAAADSPKVVETRQETADRALREGSDFLATMMEDRLFSESTRRGNRAVVSATLDVIRNTNPRAIAASLNGMAARPDIQPQLAELGIPTLLIGGQHDVISPAAEMRGIADAMPNARFVEIPDAGHMAPLEQPDVVNAAIRDFLK